MLKSLELENFTVFPSAQLSFGRNLNVFVGENGSGKTRILKAAYSAIALGLWIEKRLGHDAGTRLVPQERDHRPRIENTDHGRDSRTVSSFFRFTNDSLEVGTRRYLPLIEPAR